MHFHTPHPQLDLNGEWSFAYHLGPLPETLGTRAEVERAGLPIYPGVVPGEFPLDLQANRLIDEPFFGMNMLQLRQFERAHVWYFRTFAAPELGELRPELYFEGLDCCAEIFLNGELIAVTDNALIAHRIPVAGCLRAHNELLVHIIPALEVAAQYDYPPSLAAAPSCLESLYLRKPPHSYGWDIMPRAVSAGIWRPVTLHLLPGEHIEEVYLQTTALSADHRQARLHVHYRLQIDGDGAYELLITGQCGEAAFSWRAPVLFTAGHGVIEVTAPQLWWPRDAGAPNLYQVECTLLKDGAPLDCTSFTLGIRTVVLENTDRDANSDGQFLFRVNGEPIFIRGTNWVPADAFHSRDAARIPAMVALLDEAHCNMVRCWGGNVYENDDFFARCDASGIMVWQDFAMACALYPQDEDFQRRLAEEAHAVVKRLRQHPSLVLWAGDNENDSAFADAWFGLPPSDPALNVLTRHTLPDVLREEDPTRPYLPSSPFISAALYQAGDWHARMPEDHLWGPRDYFKSPFYARNTVHFVSEIGYMGCPDPASVRKFISPERLWPPLDNPEWLLHNTSPVPEAHNCDYRTAKLIEHLSALFGAAPDTLEEFAYASQAAQAEAYKFFIELFRGGKWQRTGIIWWNLIDGWPQFSDAVVDYYFGKKLAFHYIERAQQPLCLLLREPDGGAQELVAVNDTRQPLDCRYALSDVSTEEVINQGEARIPANDLLVLARVPADGKQRCYRLTWDSPLGPGSNHYLAGTPPFAVAQYRKWMEKL